MANIPVPPQFLPEPGEPVIPWEEWLEVFKNYLVARGDVTQEERKAALLLCCLGVEGQAQYRSIRDQVVVAPEGQQLPSEYDQMIIRLTVRFSEKKGRTATRYEFRNRRQQPGESVAEFVANLRRSLARCAFENYNANEALKEQVIIGLTESKMRERLLLEGDMYDVEQIIHAAIRMEKSSKDAMLIADQPSQPVFAIEKSRGPQSSKRCSRCKWPDHTSNSTMCPAKEAKCVRCHVKGHFARCCQQPQQENTREKVSNKPNAFVYSLSRDSGEAEIDVDVNGYPVRFLIDTGSGVSIVNQRHVQNRLGELVPCDFTVNSYSGQSIETLGILKCKLEFEGRRCECDVVVVDQERSILGRDALGGLSMNLSCRTEGFRVDALSMQSSGLSESKLRHAFPKVFSRELGLVKGFQHKVRMKPSAMPVQQKLRRIPLAVRDKVKAEIDGLLEKGVVEPVEASDWVSAMVIVGKKNGDIRVCIDLRQVNENIVPDIFPIPHMDDLFLELGKAEYFSRLDAKSAYHQVELADESRDLTTFISPWGLYRFRRVCFGLASAPAAFQRLMSRILEGLDGVLIYLDDVLVFGETRAEHDRRLSSVMLRLQKAGLTLNSKCEIGVREVEFVGFVISGKGIRPCQSNIDAIKNLAEPSTTTQIKSLLGTTGFYLKCVKDFSDVVEPIRRLLKSGAKFVWNEEQQAAFLEIKRRIIEAQPLAIFDPSKEIIVATDASDVGVGGVLLQNHSGREIPVAYTSASLTETQKRYSTGEKEALACLYAIEKWHVLLWGRRFKLRTDHQALVTLLGPKGNNRASLRIGRWFERLRGYNFEVQYKAGVTNLVPDMLSRMPMDNLVGIEDPSDVVVAHITQNLKPLKWEEIKEASVMDLELEQVRQGLRTNRSFQQKEWSSVSDELAIVDNVILRAEKIVLPESLRMKAFRIAHEDSHQGIVRTKQRIRVLFWWPAMDKFVEQAVRNCSLCARHDKTATTSTEPISITEWPERPWQRLSIDIRGPDSSLGVRYRFAVVVVDYFSKWVEVELMSEVTATKIVSMLLKLFCREGIPETIVSDNGPQFIARKFVDFLDSHGVNHLKTANYHPRANGLVERFNRTLGNFLASAKQMGGDLQARLTEMLGAYNATPHATTGCSPAELLHGRKMRTKLDVTGSRIVKPMSTMEDVRNHVEKRQNAQKTYADARNVAKELSFAPGQYARIRKPQALKGQPKFTEPMRILKRVGKASYKMEDGKIWHRNRMAAAKVDSEGEPMEIEEEGEDTSHPDSGDGRTLDASSSVSEMETATEAGDVEPSGSGEQMEVPLDPDENLGARRNVEKRSFSNVSFSSDASAASKDRAIRPRTENFATIPLDSDDDTEDEDDTEDDSMTDEGSSEYLP